MNDLTELVVCQRQAGKTYKVVAAGNEAVFSSREAAEWLMQPAMGLDQRRPIDLLGTEGGRKQVELLLIGLDHGLYT